GSGGADGGSARTIVPGSNSSKADRRVGMVKERIVGSPALRFVVATGTIVGGTSAAGDGRSGTIPSWCVEQHAPIGGYHETMAHSFKALPIRSIEGGGFFLFGRRGVRRGFLCDNCF